MDAPSDTSRREAVDRLVREHAGRLYAIAMRLCRSRDEADDLVQEVFLQVTRAWHTFEGRSSETTWLYTIATRACQRMHRRRAGQPADVDSLDRLLPFDVPLIATLPSDVPDGLSEQVHRESRERIEAAIAALPDDFRLPLVLHEIVGLPLGEVAEILGIPAGTAKTRVHRARLKLRAAMDGALPRRAAPPPAYEPQTCLDLLHAKQEALDRGVPFDQRVICDRCRSVFESLDMTRSICRELSGGEIPPDLMGKLRAMASASAG